MSLASEPLSWDPSQLAASPIPLYTQLVYDNLVSYTVDGELVPSLAEDWEYDDSQTELTLNIRDDAEFSDGTPVDAAAVVANLEHFQATPGPKQYTLADVTDFKAADDNAVVITLSEPNPSLLNDLAQAAGYIAKPDTFDDAEPTGSGPYSYDPAASRKGTEYVFNKKDDHWSDLATFDVISVLPITDVTAALNALKAHEIDATSLAGPLVEEAKAAGFTQVRADGQWLGLTIFDRNGAVVPALADAKVRQAINYAIDREGMLNTFLGGDGTLTQQVFGFNAEGNDEGLDSTYSYDVDKAKKLIEEAGYAPGEIVVDMPFVDRYGGPEMMDALKQMLEAAGITVNFQQIPPGVDALTEEVMSGKYPLAMSSYEWSATDWTTIGLLVDENATWNPLHASDPVVQDLIGKYQFGTDEERPDIAREINTYTVEQGWFVPFAWASPSWLVDPNVATTVNGKDFFPYWSHFNLKPANVG
ncbi:ABC transporter substrate-binding protein [Leucobacter allii]|uniref:ABC transporter substrate-binding protein n=1 Tax=Leucobacter allii TaxID=2932247 RepID=UPI001FD5DEF0|nr:ABC transporter substrate-binding protein [Leucobacter allii]UOR02375.1 ABC transporter substrate-binding protein [Leucobacter allii]